MIRATSEAIFLLVKFQKGKDMTIKQAAKKLNWTENFLREAIAQGKVDFGICVRMPGSSRRTFQISEKGVKEWIDGKKTTSQ